MHYFSCRLFLQTRVMVIANQTMCRYSEPAVANSPRLPDMISKRGGDVLLYQNSTRLSSPTLISTHPVDRRRSRGRRISL